jgi:dipeptidyl aminopeptidase/acylaminoacyl peptidase
MRLTLLLCLLGSTVAHARDRVVPEDFYDIVEVDAPEWSPVDDRVVYVTSVPDPKHTGYDKNLWLVNADGTGRRQLTSHVAADWAPRWSADGRRILFLSRRGGVPQAWILRAAGGAPRRVTPPGVSVWSARWIPDSNAISFVTAVPKGAKAGRKRRLVKPRPTELEKKGIKVIRHTVYFTDKGLIGSTRNHLHTLDLGTGAVFQLTEGDRNVTEYDWASDGRRAVVAFNNWPDSRDVFRTRIAVVDRRGGVRRRLKREGHLLDLSWQPGTPWVVLTDYLWDGRNNELLRVNVDRGTWTSVRYGHDGNLWNLRWQRDGKRLFAVAEKEGSVHLWSLEGATFRGRRLTSGRRQIGFHSQMWPPRSFSVSPDHARFVTTEVVSDRPRELVIGDVGTGRTVPLTDVNRGWRRRHRTVAAEKFSFEIPGGEKLDGWVIPPADRRRGRRYPLVLQIHGGPDSMYGEHFMLEFQALAGAGFGVLYLNPRGSTGYGAALKKGCVHKWPVVYDDLMTGLNAAVRRFRWIDGKRLGVAGGSFGGFMAAWIIGHTNRFKAAVTMRGVYNMVSSTLTDDIPDASHRHPRSIWEDPLGHWKLSPIAYAPRVRTPTLVIHSENDARCPVSDGDQFYRALRMNNVPAVLVRYEGEGHGLSRGGRPDRRVDRLRRIVAWFRRWL